MRVLLAAGAGLSLCLAVMPAASQPQSQVRPEQSELWRGTVEDMRARLQESLRDVEARIRRLSEEMRDDAQRGGDVDRMIETQRRVQQMQLRQREAQALQEMLNTLNNIARTLENFGESQQRRPQEQRRTVRDRLGWHVVSITMAGDAGRAELWSEHGGRMSVRVGSRLADGAEVVAVTADGVELRKPDGEVMRLEQADMAFLAMRIGQLAEEHQAGLRALGLGGLPPGMGVPGPGVMPGMPVPTPGFGAPPGMAPGGMPPGMPTGMPSATPQPPMPLQR